MARLLLLMLAALMLTEASGCQSCCRRPAAPCPPPGAQLMPRLPPAPPPPPPLPTPTGAPPPPPSISSGAATLSPRIESNWQPTEGATEPARVQLAVPEPMPDKARSSDAPLQSLPVGIPQFVEGRPRVAAGLRPSLDDGLAWLQNNGYRTVVHVHLPEEDSSADRAAVEKRGLTYSEVALSPAGLTQAQADAFVALVTDAARQPIFVYDRDGSLAGPLWYYLLRRSDDLAPEAARARARTLGLREERGGAHQAMWVAVLSLLGENNR